MKFARLIEFVRGKVKERLRNAYKCIIEDCYNNIVISAIMKNRFLRTSKCLTIGGHDGIW